MKTLSRWSWVLLLIGAFGALNAVAIRVLLGELPLAGQVIAVVSGVSLVAWALLDRDSLGKGVRSRGFRQGLTSILLVGLAAILAVAAFLVAERHDRHFDWSSADRFTMSDQSRTVATGLDQDVRVLAFFAEGSSEDIAFRSLAERFEAVTDRIEFVIVDPDASPRLARENGITSAYGTVILEAGNASQRLESDFSEEAFTHALIRLENPEDHRVCWATGHGELDPDDEFSEAGVGIAVLKLEDQNYRITPVDTLVEGIPNTCRTLVIATPDRDWEESEREAMASYVARGGTVLAMLEPGVAPELSDEFARYGIELRDDIVMDVSPMAHIPGLEDPMFVVATPDHFSMHPVTASLRASVLMGLTRSVKATAGTPGVALHELITASDESWGETNLEVTPLDDPNAWGPDPGIEHIGNVPLAVAVTITDPTELGAALTEFDTPVAGGRLVVFGTADFARNRFVGRAGNQDLVGNVVAWLVGEDEQLAERPPPDGDELDVSLLALAVLNLLAVIALPGASLAAAILMAVRRRFL